MSLDLVIGADNLHYPLTGIGRYVYELASELTKDPHISRMRYFSLGRWIEDPLARCHVQEPLTHGRIINALRDRLSGNQMVAAAYGKFAPHYFKWALRKLDRKVVFHSPNFFVLPSRATKVVTVHDLSHEFFPQFHQTAKVQLMEALLPGSLRITDHIITVSETVRTELMERYNLPPERVTAVLLAASDVYRPHSNAELVPVMAELGLKAGSYTLFVGTVEPRKNVTRLIQAYELLPKELRQDCPLVIAGGRGWNSEPIHERIGRAQREGWLRYLSFVDQNTLPALYAGARLVAYPSLYEGFGLPIVEAMASGTPVLTSNTSCMPEIAGGAAHLVDPTDVECIAYGLEACLGNEEWQATARNLGLVRASEMSWRRCCAETVAVYRRLV